MRIMLLITAIIFFSVPHCSTTTQASEQGRSPISVILSTYDTEYGLQTKIEAKLVEKVDSVEINITDIKMRLSEHCPYKGPRRLVAMKAGLAARAQNGGWRFETISERVKFDITIMPGVEHQLGPVSLSAPKSVKGSLSDYWIAVQVEEETPPDSKSSGYSFIHSCRNVFQPLVELAMKPEKWPDCHD